METTFTPLASLLGGGLIGAAAVALMAVHGRILGATGVLTRAVFYAGLTDWLWRAAMLLGMVSAPVAYWLASGQMPAIQVPVPTLALGLGGLLVGVGVTLGNGCTSGHGVCGMARLSVRSIAATLTFMIAAGVTVFVARHVLGG